MAQCFDASETSGQWLNFGLTALPAAYEHRAAVAEDKFFLPPGKGGSQCAY
jgi:hypothetical protein